MPLRQIWQLLAIKLLHGSAGDLNGVFGVGARSAADESWRRPRPAGIAAAVPEIAALHR